MHFHMSEFCSPRKWRTAELIFYIVHSRNHLISCFYDLGFHHYLFLFESSRDLWVSGIWSLLDYLIKFRVSSTAGITVKTFACRLIIILRCLGLRRLFYFYLFYRSLWFWIVQCNTTIQTFKSENFMVYSVLVRGEWLVVAYNSSGSEKWYDTDLVMSNAIKSSNKLPV